MRKGIFMIRAPMLTSLVGNQTANHRTASCLSSKNWSKGSLPDVNFVKKSTSFDRLD